MNEEYLKNSLPQTRMAKLKERLVSANISLKNIGFEFHYNLVTNRLEITDTIEKVEVDIKEVLEMESE